MNYSNPKEIKEKKDGKQLLRLYREQRKYTYPTLEGRRVEPNPFSYKMYNLIGDEIEILSKTIGGRAKTRLRKEAKENPYLEALLKRDEKKLQKIRKISR